MPLLERELKETMPVKRKALLGLDPTDDHDVTILNVAVKQATRDPVT